MGAASAADKRVCDAERTMAAFPAVGEAQRSRPLPTLAHQHTWFASKERPLRAFFAPRLDLPSALPLPEVPAQPTAPKMPVMA